MPLSRDDKEQLKNKYGELVYAEYPEGEFLFRTPDERAYGRFLAAGAAAADRKNGDRLTPFKQLCIDCLVFPETGSGQPDHQALIGLFARLPGLPLTVGAELADSAGAGDSAKVGKL